MLQVFKVGEVLWKRDDVLFESRNATVSLAEVASTCEVANADLHMVQRHKHGLNHGGIARQVEPLFVCSADVQAKQWIPIVPG